MMLNMFLLDDIGSVEKKIKINLAILHAKLIAPEKVNSQTF